MHTDALPTRRRPSRSVRKVAPFPTLPPLAEMEAAVGLPFVQWAHQCHAVSHALVQHVLEGRVARGVCRGVGGQHSWVVLGHDAYDADAWIVDPTLWSYDVTVVGVYVGTLRTGQRHRPHQAGRIFEYGRPSTATDPDAVIDLVGVESLSPFARSFLEMLLPLDRRGWSILANSPVEGWPAGEILAAMDDTPRLRALVPIDALGMLTDRNPGGLYLRTVPSVLS